MSHFRPALHLATVVSICLASPAWAILVTGSEQVFGSGSTAQYTHNGVNYGPYGWDYQYVRSFDGTQLVKDIQIGFFFDGDLNFTPEQQDAFIATVEAGIEGLWNNKFNVRDNNTGLFYPVAVDMRTDGALDHLVSVEQSFPGANSDLFTWYHEDPVSIFAHEFGHLMGLFDEYIGGAVNQYPNPLLSSDGLMGLGARLAEPVLYERYYQQYLDYIYELNPEGSFSLLVVPEPAAWLLVAMAAAALVVFRRGSRSRMPSHR